MSSRKIVAISAGLSTPSSSRMLSDKLLQASVEELSELSYETEAKSFELREYAHDITNMMLTGFPAKKLELLLKELETADGIIAVTPIFTTAYSGLFKSFIDLIDPKALQGKPVLLGASAGTPRHSLALDYSIRPLFTYLHMEPVSTAVFAASSDWGTDADNVAPLAKRVSRGAKEFALAMSMKTQKANFDPYDASSYEENCFSFEQLLGGAQQNE